jgi:hypothetical protein
MYVVDLWLAEDVGSVKICALNRGGVSALGRGIAFGW